MRRFSLLLLASVLFLAACSSETDASALAVENYLTALAAKNSDLLSSLSCAGWEESAQMELDSFQAVDVKLDSLSCATTGTDGEAKLVTCQGKLVATYGSENQELDLSTRRYEVVQQGGDWLVCGVR
jgi:hypothetical protein